MSGCNLKEKLTDRQKASSNGTPYTCTSSNSVPQRNKRTYSNMETDHSSATDSREHQDKKSRCVRFNFASGCCNESSSSHTDTYRPVSLENVPEYTSEWTEEVLSCLRVKVDQDVPDMYNVFLQGCIHFISDQLKCAEVMRSLGAGDISGSRLRSEKHRIIVDCYQHVFQHVFTLHCDNVSWISIDDLKELEKNLENAEWIEVFVEQYSQNFHIKETCERILLDIAKKLQKFVWQLIYMKRKLDLKKEISEGMYQELFKLFAETFNLHLVAGSNVEKYSLDIGDNRGFIAVPDAVVGHPTTEEDQICAVVNVKKYDTGKRDTQGNLRGLRSNERTISITDHIGSDLKGQHVGQTLCVHSSSLFGDKGVFGILVQGTKVTLSAFKAEISYYDNLCAGLVMEKEARITFSKEHNILRKDGRLECIQTFLDLKKLLEYICEKKFS